MIIRVIALTSIVIVTMTGMVFASFKPEEWPSVAAFVTPTVVGLFVLVQVEEQKKQHSEENRKTRSDVHEFHQQANSRFDELLALTARAAREAGAKEEKEAAAERALDAQGD